MDKSNVKFEEFYSINPEQIRKCRKLQNLSTIALSVGSIMLILALIVTMM